MGNILTLTPPLTLTLDEMDQALDVLEACLTEVAEHRIAAGPAGPAQCPRTPCDALGEV